MDNEIKLFETPVLYYGYRPGAQGFEVFSKATDEVVAKVLDIASARNVMIAFEVAIRAKGSLQLSKEMAALAPLLPE